MSGSLSIVGLGPGSEAQVTPEATQVLMEATDIVGYGSYIDRLTPQRFVVLHRSGNGVELERAREALNLAVDGKKVALVTSGDPGVFAMAAAVFEAVDAQPKAWASVEIRILPGITALLAAAARVGAPIGNDFCAINLSDNLKPWALIEKRLRLAVEADFVIACYNPRSRARPDGFARVLTLLRQHTESKRIIAFARAVSTQHEQIKAILLEDCRPEMADMQTLVLIGNSATRMIEQNGKRWVYTPRLVGLRKSQ
ncbi:MAG: precorrin-3B C(17)-methyltransferase [Aestuariivita sp.]|nr:precorrin-3B C(17)-methyltransferase [Aestuariivita sp.]MCY4346538.1 precorrin-3B C(17)-methyltransferase [Aestuariivita sp.]